jgi:hypothetical protein
MKTKPVPRSISSFYDLGILLPVALLTSCATLPIDQAGVWRGGIPQEKITVREAARVERPVAGKVVAPFALTLLSGSRTGLEWNEGRDLRATEIINGIPFVGYITLPYWCYEALTGAKMQPVANHSKIDARRERKYLAVIERLKEEKRAEEAQFLAANNPFKPENHPPNPLATIPAEEIAGVWGKTKIITTELFVGHRVALERNESRGLRKLEYWHPLLVTRLWEAFEAGAGKRMEDIAVEENLDERWLEKTPAAPSAPAGHTKPRFAIASKRH